MEYVSAVCLYVLTAWSVAPPNAVAQHTCEDVGAAALVEGVSPVEAIALAYTESRLNPRARSPRDASGPLQIIPWFHCPGRTEKGCDLVGAGVRSMIRFRKKYGSEWLCHWNSGNRCFRRSRLFARIVKRRVLELSRAVGGECLT